LSIYCGNKNSIQLSNFQSNNQRLTINKNNTLFPKQFINSNFQFQQKNLNSTVSLNKPNSFTLLPFLIKKRIVNSDDSNNSRKKFILKRKYCILDDKNCNSNIILNNLIKKNAFDYSKNVCKTSSIISKSQFHSSSFLKFKELFFQKLKNNQEIMNYFNFGNQGNGGRKFPYIGLIFLTMLTVPNIIWTKNMPKDYEKYVDNENKFLLSLERVGEVLVTAISLLFTDYSSVKMSSRSYLLPFAFLAMILYEIYWIRYFKSEKTMNDFYSGIVGIPLAGATLPVIAYLLLGIYSKNIPLIVSVIILGIGHIGIHYNHKKEITDSSTKSKSE